MDTITAPRHVTFSSRRFLRTYRHVGFVLQLLCVVATTSTFYRVCEQRHLPMIFLALPFLLFVVAIFMRFTPVREAGVAAIVCGASTGAVAGFLSTIVDSAYSSTSFSRDAVVNAARRSSFSVGVLSLEFLHIPAVSGAVMYSFCLLFTRFPPVALLVLAGATAACGTTIFGIGLVILNDPGFSGFGNDASGGGSSNGGFDPSDGFRIARWTVTLAVVFFGIFVASLLPLLRTNRQAWVVCFGMLVASAWWQTDFLDSMQWDWDNLRFPIPGTLVGVVVLFMLDVIEMTETTAEATGDKRHLSRLDVVDEPGSGAVSEILLSSMTWHVASYIVERTSLTFILESRSNRSKIGHRPSGSDVWLCCLGMIGLVSISSPMASTLFSVFGRNVTVCLALTLYLCITLISGELTNGYFIDDVLGLSLLATTAASDFAADVS